MLNISKGFDITDEGYYLLSALYPEDITATVTHEGFYTNILFSLVNYNLAHFRLLGLIILFVISIWFAIEVYKYFLGKLGYVFNISDLGVFAIPVAAGGLIYYKYWMLTPSYNWLALVSVLLVFIALLRVVSSKELIYPKYFSFEYVLLSFALTLSFMAKPTTALVVFVLAILVAFFEFRNINLKKAIPAVALMTGLIFFLHILILDGGYSAYIYKVKEGVERAALLGGGHTLSNRAMDAFVSFKSFYVSFYIHKISVIYLYLAAILMVVLFFLRKRTGVVNLYITYATIILLASSYFILGNVIQDYRLLWIGLVELLLLLMIMVGLLTIFLDEKRQHLFNVLKVLPVLLIIVFGSFAYRFGTGGQVIYAMSDGVVFVIAAILVLAYIFDKGTNTKVLMPCSGIIMLFYTSVLIQGAYDKPYRIITSIKGQDQYVNFLGGIYVDQQQKRYIEALQSLKQKAMVNNEEIRMIDMTGGTPSANVILGAKFFGTTWILGGYKGSEQFATRVLSAYQGTEALKRAWVLTAPKGSRRINISVLKSIGLDFPESYKKLGSIKTAHRNEIQELWMPK